MKNTSLILLGAIALASARSTGVYPNGCPVNWDEEKLLPHPNCNRFYQCWDGKLVPLTCPSKLYFSIEQNRCEWAEVVDCVDREVPDDNNDDADDNGTVGGGNSDPSLAPEICAAEGSDDVLVANENCNQFYICAHGQPVALSCPDNLLFNPQNDRCDWPKNVDCGDRVIPEVDNEDTEENDDGEASNENESDGNGDDTEGDDDDVVVGGGNDDPSLAPEICAAEGSDDVLVANENCNQFYICDNGKPVAQICPNNLLFNPQTDRCDWPKNVNCGDRVIPEVDSEDTEENDDGEASNESESDSNEDDTEENDDDDVVVGGGNDDPSLAPEICAAEGSDDVLVANENCNQFYICDNGKPVAQTCPNNLLFNPQTDRCDWPKNVDCGDRVIPEVDSEDTEENDDGEASNESESDSNEDDTEEDDDDVVVGGGNDDPSLAPEICAAEGSDDVLVANENCNQFYICDNGKPVAQICPNNLLFNPQTDRCDWPKNVNCGDRVIPEVDSEDTEENDDGEASNESESDSNEDDTEENDDDDVVVGGGNDDPSLAPEICAAEGSDDVLVANENCNQFYICDNGKPVAQTCPNNLLFNPQTDRCDWPKNVDCGDRVIPEVDSEDTEENDDGEASNENESDGNGDDTEENDDDDVVVGGGNDDPSLAPEICAAEGSDDVLVANENCNQFYICDNGKPVAQTCPNNLLFNPQTDRCDWPKNVDCGDRVIPEVDSEDTEENDDGEASNENESDGNGDDTEEDDDDVVVGGGNDDPSLAPEICAAEGSDDVLVANENCNQFYICDNGKPVAQTCPNNLLFNPQTDRCDWPKNVDCGDRVIPEVDSEDTEENDDGEASNENESDGNGDDTEENDDDDVVVGGGNDDPSLAPEICAAEGSDDVLVANENCNQFYICDNGKPVAQTCPNNLLFNPQTDRCDWPKNVDCGDRVIPEVDSEDTEENDDGEASNENESDGNGDDTEEDDDDVVVGGGNDDPSLAPEICAAEGSDDVLVANENCNQFYICDNGKPVAQTCPNNLLFNPQTDRCDWPKNVDCGDRVIPEVDSEDTEENDDGEASNESESDSNEDDTEENDDDDVVVGGGNDDPSLAPEICAAEGSDDVLVANENCNQFYICDNGKPVAQTCPNNLLFNPQTDRCDWPKNVDCGDRVIPEIDSEDTEENDDSEASNENESNSNEDDTEENDDDDVVVGGGNDDPSLAPEICAAEGSDDVLVANENCNQFYICDNGKPVAQTCPNNLLFNPQTDRCDWPKNVDCGDRVIPEVDSEDTEENDDGEASNENESDGNGDDTEEDDHDVVVGGGNDDPSLAPEICAAEGSDDVLVANENCNQFYICDNGKPVAQTCPNNLLFNPQTDRCDWPKKVDCGDRVIPEGDGVDTDENKDSNESDDNGSDSDESDDSESNSDEGPNNESSSEENDDDKGVGGGNDDPNLAPEICAAEGSEDVLVAHTNCNQFYICSGGQPITQSCPVNLLFNPQTDRCDWPKNVDCGDRVIPDGDNENDDDDNNNENEGEDNEDSDEDNVDDNESENDNNGSDDESEGNENGSSDEEVVGGGNSDPSKAPEICAAEGSDNVLVANEDCNKFYICVNGKPLAQKCPANLFFNPQIDRCDWPNNVVCGDRVDPDTENDEVNNENECVSATGGAGNDDPRKVTEICASENSQGVLVAHEDCSQFYVCDHSKPIAVKCPATLLFNPHSDRCDWSSCVDCDRQTALNKHMSARRAIRSIH